MRLKAKEYCRSRLGSSEGGPDRKAEEGSAGCTNDTWRCESKQDIGLISQEEILRRTASQGNGLCHCPAPGVAFPLLLWGSYGTCVQWALPDQHLPMGTS